MLGNELLFNGIRTLTDLERTGICIDVPYIIRQKKILKCKINRLEKEMLKTKEGQVWKKVYGRELNFNSGPQIGDVLFNHLGFKANKTTATGLPSTSREELEKVDTPIIEMMVLRTKLQDCRNKFLGNILKEQVDGILHPDFGLNIAITYRSESRNPNFQNFPNRDAMMQKIVKTCLIPRPGNRLGEFDYSGIEVGIGCSYHKDPVMISYVNNPEKDMHRDMACEIYLLEPKEVAKLVRWSAKNGFVFPEFYGDWWKSCAKVLWSNITELNLKTVAGVPLKEHLKNKGIKNYKAFESHIEAVEDHFWNVRFKVYNKWKQKFWKEYQRKGYIDTLTGFRLSSSKAGPMGFKDVSNYPIQGSAFHCLLWSVIVMNQRLKEEGMETKIVGQIHDSCVSDFPDEELQDWLNLAQKVMTEEIYETYSWINTNLSAEFEVTPINKSWLDKEEWVKDSSGIWIKKAA